MKNAGVEAGAVTAEEEAAATVAGVAVVAVAVVMAAVGATPTKPAAATDRAPRNPNPNILELGPRPALVYTD